MSRIWLPVLAIACGIAGSDPAARGAESEPFASFSFVETCAATTDRPAVTAIGLRASQAVTAKEAAVLILVDTSASQTGVHRRRAGDAIVGILREARPGDRFSLAAVDIACKPLMEGFHATPAEALTEAIETLESRAPLGSSEAAPGISILPSVVARTATSTLHPPATTATAFD